MSDYYADHLAAEKLRRCYEIAPPRVRQYLRSELDFALGFIRPGDAVLDLGCGYGRTLPDLAARAARVTAVDNAPASVALARKSVSGLANVAVVEMDAAALQLPGDCFDVVLCLQNGISAFHRDPRALLREALRVCRPGGAALFSTYAEKFWPQRLEWFKLQSAAGLLGEIDWRRTRNGFIACQDGFTATTFSAEQFRSLAAGSPSQHIGRHPLGGSPSQRFGRRPLGGLPAELTLTEVDGSSLFCILKKQGARPDQ